jgi:zinc transport system permease protein
MELSTIYGLIGKMIPMECMEMGFMQQAMLGLILLAPMAAMMGVQVVNFRMSFFADAISHSTFTGIAIGLMIGLSPGWTTPIFALLLGISIIAVQRKTNLPTDAVIGVFLAGVVAFGIVMVSREPNLARNIKQFLYGDILSISDVDIFILIILAMLLTLFQIFAFNKLLYIGINPTLSSVHGVSVAPYQYIFSAFLAVLVVFSVRAAGVILAPGLFIVPAAAARNFSKSAGGMLWWALIIAFTSAVAGLLISAQEWAGSATGATVVLVAFAWFIVSAFVGYSRKGRG